MEGNGSGKQFRQLAEAVHLRWQSEIASAASVVYDILHKLSFIKGH